MCGKEGQVNKQNPLNIGSLPINTGPQFINAGVQPINAGPQPINAGVQPINAGPQPINMVPQPINAVLQPIDADPRQLDAGHAQQHQRRNQILDEPLEITEEMRHATQRQKERVDKNIYAVRKNEESVYENRVNMVPDSRDNVLKHNVRKAIIENLGREKYKAIDEVRIKSGEERTKEVALHHSTGSKLALEGNDVIEFNMSGSGYKYFRKDYKGIVGKGNKWDPIKESWYNRSKLLNWLPFIKTKRQIENYNNENKATFEKIDEIYGKVYEEKVLGQKLNHLRKKESTNDLGAKKTRYTLCGPNLTNTGKYSEDNLELYILELAKSSLKPKFEKWGWLEDDQLKEVNPVNIIIQGHSRGGVASGLGAMRIKRWIADNYPRYLDKVHFQLIQFDPVAGGVENYGNNAMIDHDPMDAALAKKDKRYMSLGDEANTTVFYSLHTKKYAGFTPQLVKNPKRIILSMSDHHIDLHQSDKDNDGTVTRATYLAEKEGTVQAFRGTGIGDLDEGIYFADDNHNLIRIRSLEEYDAIASPLLKGSKTQSSRHEVVREAVQAWFERNGEQLTGEELDKAKEKEKLGIKNEKAPKSAPIIVKEKSEAQKALESVKTPKELVAALRQKNLLKQMKPKTAKELTQYKEKKKKYLSAKRSGNKAYIKRLYKQKGSFIDKPRKNYLDTLADLSYYLERESEGLHKEGGLEKIVELLTRLRQHPCYMDIDRCMPGYLRQTLYAGTDQKIKSLYEMYVLGKTNVVKNEALENEANRQEENKQEEEKPQDDSQKEIKHEEIKLEENIRQEKNNDEIKKEEKKEGNNQEGNNQQEKKQEETGREDNNLQENKQQEIKQENNSQQVIEAQQKNDEQKAINNQQEAKAHEEVEAREEAKVREEAKAHQKVEEVKAHQEVDAPQEDEAAQLRATEAKIKNLFGELLVELTDNKDEVAEALQPDEIWYRISKAESNDSTSFTSFRSSVEKVKRLINRGEGADNAPTAAEIMEAMARLSESANVFYDAHRGHQYSDDGKYHRAACDKVRQITAEFYDRLSVFMGGNGLGNIARKSSKKYSVDEGVKAGERMKKLVSKYSDLKDRHAKIKGEEFSKINEKRVLFASFAEDIEAYKSTHAIKDWPKDIDETIRAARFYQMQDEVITRFELKNYNPADPNAAFGSDGFYQSDRIIDNIFEKCGISLVSRTLNNIKVDSHDMPVEIQQKKIVKSVRDWIYSDANEKLTKEQLSGKLSKMKTSLLEVIEKNKNRQDVKDIEKLNEKIMELKSTSEHLDKVIAAFDQGKLSTDCVRLWLDRALMQERKLGKPIYDALLIQNAVNAESHDNYINEISSTISDYAESLEEGMTYLQDDEGRIVYCRSKDKDKIKAERAYSSPDIQSGLTKDKLQNLIADKKVISVQNGYKDNSKFLHVTGKHASLNDILTRAYITARPEFKSKAVKLLTKKLKELNLQDYAHFKVTTSTTVCRTDDITIYFSRQADPEAVKKFFAEYRSDCKTEGDILAKGQDMVVVGSKYSDGISLAPEPFTAYMLNYMFSGEKDFINSKLAKEYKDKNISKVTNDFSYSGLIKDLLCKSAILANQRRGKKQSAKIDLSNPKTLKETKKIFRELCFLNAIDPRLMKDEDIKKFC